MVFPYVLAKVKARNESKILESIKKINGVKKASLTYGNYDLCVESEFKSIDELDDFIFTAMRKSNGIKETVTLMTADK